MELYRHTRITGYLIHIPKGAAKDLKIGNLPAEQFVLGAGAESESNQRSQNW